MRRPFSSDLVSRLRETVQRVAEIANVDPNDPAFNKLKKSLVLKLADQEPSEPPKMNPSE